MHLHPVKHKASTDSQQDTRSANALSDTPAPTQPLLAGQNQCVTSHMPAEHAQKALTPARQSEGCVVSHQDTPAPSRAGPVSDTQLPAGHGDAVTPRAVHMALQTPAGHGDAVTPSSGSPCDTHQLPVMPWLLHMPSCGCHQDFEGTNSTGDTRPEITPGVARSA